MATGKIKTLFSDIEKTEALFPRTKVNAVSDADGTGLDAILGDLNSEIGTKATEAFVTNKIAEAQLSGGSGGNIDLSGYATKDDISKLTASDVDAVAKADIRKAFASVDDNGNTTVNAPSTYPTKPGVYRVVNKYPELPPNAIGYGTLTIFNGGSYVSHLYRDYNNDLYVCGTGGDGDYNTDVPSSGDWALVYTDKHKPTIAEIGAAPAMFGLGDIAPYTTIATTEQLDNCRSAGFYRYGITGSNLAGVGFNFGSLTVYPIWTDGCVQEVRPMNGNCMIRRFFFRDVWSAWEVDNPPMAVGVEYRTTERWNGKPVYQIFLSAGAFTNPIVVKPPGFDNIRVIEMHGELRMTENADNTLTVPCRFGNNEVWIDQSFAYSQQPRFRSTDGWDWPIGRPFYLRLKYWKYSD